MELEHLSPSRIGTFDQCQGKYHAQYVEKKRGESHPLTNMGSGVHLMFERATNAIQEAQRNQWDSFISPMDFKVEACKEEGVLPEHFDLVEQLTQNALDWGYFRNIERCVGVEVKFSIVLPDKTPVVGIIDRLDVFKDLGEVIDLKTQKRAFDSATLHENWQARTYNMAARHLQEIIKGRVTVSFWVLRHQVQKVVLSADDAKRTQDDLMAKAAEIRDVTTPDYKPSGLCPWCPAFKTCAASKEGVKKRFNRRQGK